MQYNDAKSSDFRFIIQGDIGKPHRYIYVHRQILKQLEYFGIYFSGKFCDNNKEMVVYTYWGIHIIMLNLYNCKTKWVKPSTTKDFVSGLSLFEEWGFFDYLDKSSISLYPVIFYDKDDVEIRKFEKIITYFLNRNAEYVSDNLQAIFEESPKNLDFIYLILMNKEKQEIMDRKPEPNIYNESYYYDSLLDNIHYLLSHTNNPEIDELEIFHLLNCQEQVDHYVRYDKIDKIPVDVHHTEYFLNKYSDKLLLHEEALSKSELKKIIKYRLNCGSWLQEFELIKSGNYQPSYHNILHVKNLIPFNAVKYEALTRSDGPIFWRYNDISVGDNIYVNGKIHKVTSVKECYHPVTWSRQYTLYENGKPINISGHVYKVTEYGKQTNYLYIKFLYQ